MISSGAALVHDALQKRLFHNVNVHGGLRALGIIGLHFDIGDLVVIIGLYKRESRQIGLRYARHILVYRGNIGLCILMVLHHSLEIYIAEAVAYAKDDVRLMASVDIIRYAGQHIYITLDNAVGNILQVRRQDIETLVLSVKIPRFSGTDMIHQ